MNLEYLSRNVFYNWWNDDITNIVEEALLPDVGAWPVLGRCLAGTGQCKTKAVDCQFVMKIAAK